MPKTIASMKTRLEHALLEADEADEVVELLKQAVARFGIRPTDLFTKEELEGHAYVQEAPYADRDGNTWKGRGRRPIWLMEALEKGAELEDFRNPRFRG